MQALTPDSTTNYPIPLSQLAASHNLGGTTSTPTKSGSISVMGWIFTAAVVVVLYEQFKDLRPLIGGVIILICLGVVLRYEPSVVTSFRSIGG